MATASAVLALRKQLQSATADNKTEDAVRVLQQLKKEFVATEELLRETKIGVTVNKLKSNSAKEIADLSKELVRKWKSDVGQTGTKKQGKPDAAAASGSASAAASPSPAPTPTSPAPKTEPTPSITTTIKPVPASAPDPAAADSPSASTSSASAPNPLPPVRRQSSGGPPRTHKSDGLDFSRGEGATKDKTRDKCAELIYDALASDSGAPTELIQTRARALEKYVWDQTDAEGGGAGVATYRNKMRSFFLNLKAVNNPGLREDVVSGEISIVKLYNMDPKDMASDERKEENRRLVAENLFKAQAAAPQQAETDAFQCGKCKQRRCMYYQMQTRSADEPMTASPVIPAEADFANPSVSVTSDSEATFEGG
ncbi:hypothetical protein JCM11251_003929 [Rhodosporidiobolus azoricus]